MSNWKNSLASVVMLVSLTGVTAAATEPDAAHPDSVAPQTESSHTRRVLEIEQINVTGNSRISETDILGTLGLSPRDTVNALILEEARLRLLGEQQVLTTAGFATRPGSQRGLVVLDVTVAEHKSVRFETGYGQHDVYGWFLTLLGMRVDPARDRGTDIGLGLRLGFQIAGVDGKFERRTGVGHLGFGGNFHLYQQEQIFYAGSGDGPVATDSTTARRFTQKIGRVGTELYLLYELASRTRFTFGLRLEDVRPDSVFTESEGGRTYQFSDFPPALQPDIRNTFITGLFLRTVRDTRDLFIYPRTGSFTFLELQSNSTFLGGDEIYAKARFDYRKHFDLGSWRTFAGRLGAGMVSNGAPYHERFYIGGIYTVRGFPELSLSPPPGDDGFVIANAELRVPLISVAKAPPRLTGLVFVDAGLRWRWEEPAAAATVDVAMGYGVRLRLPWLGTLGLDVGIPFTDGRTDDPFRVHGILGFSF